MYHDDEGKIRTHLSTSLKKTRFLWTSSKVYTVYDYERKFGGKIEAWTRDVWCIGHGT